MKLIYKSFYKVGKYKKMEQTFVGEDGIGE